MFGRFSCDEGDAFFGLAIKRNAADGCFCFVFYSLFFFFGAVPMSGDEAAFLFEYSFKFFVGIYFCYMLISVVEGFVVDILLNGFKEVFYIVFYTLF